MTGTKHASSEYAVIRKRLSRFIPMVHMEARRTWMATVALITFVMGGMVMPVLHRVDHAAERYEQQSAAHRHGQPVSESMAEACADLRADLQDCHFCQRNVISELVSDRTGVVDFRAQPFAAAVPKGITHPLDAFSPIRAPPVTA